MKIIKCDNYDDMSLKASELIIKDMQNKKNICLGLATGSTPIGLYKHLIQANKQNKITFKDVISFNLDEYVGISQQHPQSYYQYMMTHLFNHVDMNKSHIHLPNNDQNHLQNNVNTYNKLLNNTQIDLQVLGIGNNGHIGFNEPNTPFENETFIVDLDEDTRKANQRFFDSLEEVPTKAITMGIKNIMQAKKIVLLASGKQKAQAVKQMIDGEVTPKMPASVLQLHPNVYIFVDKEAGALI